MHKYSIKVIASITLSVAVTAAIAHGWSGLTASPGDTLTHTKWNELLDVAQTPETDPTVNTLAKTSLLCAANQIAQFDGTNWICANLTANADMGYQTVTNVVPYNTGISSYWASASCPSGKLLIGGSCTSGGGTTGGTIAYPAAFQCYVNPGYSSRTIVAICAIMQ